MLYHSMLVYRCAQGVLRKLHLLMKTVKDGENLQNKQLRVMIFYLVKPELSTSTRSKDGWFADILYNHSCFLEDKSK